MPAGRPFGSHKDKPFREALRMEIAAAGDDLKQLRKLARVLLDKGEAGDLQAIEQIANRTDGKPAQEQTVTIDDKRDATDWKRDELVAILNESQESGERTDPASGRNGKPDIVH